MSETLALTSEAGPVELKILVVDAGAFAPVDLVVMVIEYVRVRGSV